MKTSLDAATLDDVERRLAAHDEVLSSAYPGDDGTRQPVHTVYVPAHQYAVGLAEAWGVRARESLSAQGTDALLDAVGVRADLRDAVAAQVTAKLAAEPIEDLRIDLEDGYGAHPDPDEDAVTVAAATALRTELDEGRATPFVGIRFKCFEKPTRARGLRTLDLFLSTLATSGDLPDGLVVTLPKVTAVEQVEAMVAVCERIERATGLRAGRLRFEVQVETPQSILDAAGTATVARMIHAGGGRVTGLHYGTYDYSASLGIAAAYQSMEHPAADLAKEVMQLAAAGTGVRLSDGSTNVLPVGDAAQVRAAWANHGRLVRRSLERGYYQGWDLHPAQLPSRFAATYAFYRDGFAPAAERLHDYVNRVEGAVLDEPATAKALAWYLKRGLDCGALSAQEIGERAGLQPEELTAMVARPAV
ncbi:aldolase/citrate lyase family protein [Isoptericola hypogeus]|uniref:Aldolase/citrate lyase family protein n=1 Tax=Isoptericola hypogeus TaxID=300179 RepID=A0ABP4VXV0_9MICO